MKIVNRDQHHTHMDARLTPVVTVRAGEQLAIETMDACYGRVRSADDFARYRSDPQRKTDPLAGPVFVEGARGGGTLVIDILNIELDETGFQLIGPQRAIIRDEVADWDCYVVRVENGFVRLNDRLELPADPVVGTLGNAPAEGRTNQPNPLGGNLDCPQIRQGARVYLPVAVDGAFFFLGDVHARQGDGEIVGAPEIGARVTVLFGVLDHAVAPWPLVEDTECWHVLTCGPTEEDALRRGAFALARFIQERYDLSFNDALVLLTMCVSIRCSRTGGHGPLERVVTTSIQKSLLEHAKLPRTSAVPG
jgi:amidase